MTTDTAPAPRLMLRSSQPILAVADVRATIRFYREVLGFQSEWVWGDTPDFGGVRWGGIHVMFCLQPSLAGRVEGHMHAFFCDDVNALREQHREAGAPVISEIANKPWGIREYTVRDINGYHLRFGGPAAHDPSAPPPAALPDYIDIVERVPTPGEFAALAAGVGWKTEDVATTVGALRNSLFGVVAVDRRSGRAVGTARVVGDGVKFFYVQDVMVLPEFQNQRIGSAVMEAVMARLRRTAPRGSWIGLFTGRPSFYERHGFASGGGMSLCL